MSRSQDDVMAEIVALIPPGDLANDEASVLARMFLPLAAEISLFEAQAEEMFVEVDPGEANYLLADYERVLGPDPYGRDATALSIADQRALALSRWTQKQGVRPVDFIALAAQFGIVITIQEYALTEVGDFAGVFLVDNPTQFTWLVNLPPVAVEIAEADSASAGDLLSSFAPSLVQPVIVGRAPAHTTPVFSYG